VHGARNKYQEKSCMYEAIDDELQLMVLIWEWIPAMLSGDWNPDPMHALQPRLHANVKLHAMCCLGQLVKLPLEM